MIADSLDELHTLADKLRLKREYYQPLHYDLTASKRAQAIRLGAIPLEREAFAAAWKRIRNDKNHY